MLQKIERQTSWTRLDARKPSSAELFSSVVAFLRQQYPVIVVTILVALALGAVYLVSAKPTFTATATLIIDSRKNQLFQQQSVLGDIPVDSSSVESQVQILKSESVALSVIKELNLAEDPEFSGSGGGLIGTLIGGVTHLFSAANPNSDFEATRRTVEAFAGRLAVRRVGLTYIIEVAFTSYSADRAAQIANAVADAYITDQLEAKYQATRRASFWLQDRIKELRNQASVAERSVVEFKANNNIVESGGRLMNEQQLAELNSELVAARSKVSETKAKLDRIESILKSDSPDVTVDATVTDTLNSPVVTKLRSQYLEMASREADWSRRYGVDHQAAVSLRIQMQGIRAAILDELRRLGESYKSDYQIASQREASIQKELSTTVSESQVTNQAQVSLRDLESSAQTYRALYDNFLQRYMESVQQQSFPITEARVITNASRPLRPSAPRKSLVLGLSGVIGLVLGLGLARLRDLSDRVFRTSEQVETILETDCLAVFPKIARKETKQAVAHHHEPPVSSNSRIIQRNDGLFWHVVDEPFSRFSESIRSLKVAADLQNLSRQNRVIGFTSTLPNEGKSTIAGSFAELLAKSGARTLLVDCDLRNPSLTRALTPAARSGLLEYLGGSSSVADILWKDQTTNLDFLPAVVKTRFAHSSEVIGSDAMKEMFDTLLKTYDYIVVDLSPLAPVVDVRVTTKFIDSYVFVVEWERTRIEVVEHALGVARGVKERMLGVALNKADVSRIGRYGHEGYYYQNPYYSRYGYSD
jgi:succinoglycan biosynthesis transport protein ExoP